MNYTPNLAARSLITRRTGTVGVVVSDITNPFYPELLDILHNELALAGYRTILFNEQTDASVEQHVGELVNGAAVDGLVYVSATLDTPLPGHGARDLPVVLVNRYIDSAPVDTVVSDNYRGGRLVAEAMVALRTPADRADHRPREHDDEPRPRARLPGAARGERRPARRGAPPRRPVQPPQRLPVVPRPPRRGAPPDGRLRRERRDRVRSSRRCAPRRRPRPRRALDRRLRRHRHGRLGGLQPDDRPPAARRDGPRRLEAPARADRLGRRCSLRAGASSRSALSTGTRSRPLAPA